MLLSVAKNRRLHTKFGQMREKKATAKTRIEELTAKIAKLEQEKSTSMVIQGGLTV